MIRNEKLVILELINANRAGSESASLDWEYKSQ